MNSNYYSQKLASGKLKACYELASDGVKEYLDREIEFVLNKINRRSKVLELGCGYGRVLEKLSPYSRLISGIDTSLNSLVYASEWLSGFQNIHLAQMNAVRTAFTNKSFDVVICIQNGISAFKVDRSTLIIEAIRITKSGGIVLFSSYSDNFWEERLNWFRKQAECNLIGEIDFELTKNGIIVCKDGFISETVKEEEFISLCSNTGYTPIITEIRNSSLFCEINVI